MSEGKQDYYNVGSKDNIVISSSSLKHISPNEGGSPLQFLNFFEEKIEEKESRALKLGKLIHLWAEDRNKFYISEVSKPSEIMGIIADRVIQEIMANGTEFTRELCFDVSKMMNYQSRWTDETRLKNVYDGICAYVNEFLEAEGELKLYITKSEAEVIEKCTDSIEKHPLAKALLFMQDNDFTNAITLKEQEVYWEQRGTMFKAKLDDVTINHEAKSIFINDLKTMSSPVYYYKNFKYYRTYRQLAFYWKAVTVYCEQNNIDIDGYEFSYNIIAVETTLLNQCVVWNIKQPWIIRGRLEIKDLVARIKWHVENDEWNFQREEVCNASGEIDGHCYLEMPYEEED